MSPLSIRSETMLGTHHSWAVVMRNLLSQFKIEGHKLYLRSTNGDSLIPSDLKSRLNRNIATPDIDICYTLPRNFRARFREKSKVKMAIYNYETSILPNSWVNDIKWVDYALPSSNFSKEVFVNSGWPEEKCIVIPHGINPDDFTDKSVYKFHSNKSFKFLNISIPHYRKNIDLLIDSYYSAFSAQDDVCLIIKTNLALPNRKLFRFEANVVEQIKLVQQKHLGKSGGLPDIEIVQERVESMIPLYNGVNAVVSASSTEGFGMPLLEGLAAEKIVIAPRCTGQLDFLNDQNALLVDVKEIDAGSKYQYWKPSPGARTFLPLADDLADNMLKAYNNYDLLQNSFSQERLNKVKEFTWKNAAKKILEIK